MVSRISCEEFINSGIEIENIKYVEFITDDYGCVISLEITYETDEDFRIGDISLLLDK